MEAEQYFFIRICMERDNAIGKEIIKLVTVEIWYVRKNVNPQGLSLSFISYNADIISHLATGASH